MSEAPVKKQKRRATILVTGPQSKKTIFDGEGIKEEEENGTKNQSTLQDLTLARQRLHNELAAVNTASGIEILVQIVMDELEIIRYRIRENGLRMRRFFSDGANQIRAILFRIFSKSISSRNMIEYKNEAKVIMNEVGDQKNTYKMPRCTLNDIEEILFTDDLEDGIIQRRSEKWTCLPERQKPLYEDEGDSFCEFRSLNVPMSMMTYEDDEMDRLSMPSTRTGVTTLTAEDQMAAIQNQLAMLSKQLMSLQKNGVEVARGSSRASSRRGARKMEKKPSVEISSDSSSSGTSEDEGKGPSVCSPSLSLNRKVSESSSSKHSSTVSVQIAPMALAPPPPPPPPPPMMMSSKTSLIEIKSENLKTPTKTTQKKKTCNSLPPAETIVSNRPYLTDIANGRSLLKKTVRSPGGSPACQIRHQKRAVSSFEAALRDRFRGFHGDTSFSEQEENGEDDDVNATWDE
uniref:WH2 domain-containing protein n=1 Tax=Caenorhabditis tropicalis TaxID=1561998 RepID=A0A1I7T3W6_9PELO